MVAMLLQCIHTALPWRSGRKDLRALCTVVILSTLMWCCLLSSHQPAEVWVGELNVAPRDSPQPVREASVLSRMLHGRRFAKQPFHVNRWWRQSSRSRIVAADSGTRLFQFALWAMLQYALHRRSLAGRMALVRATPWPITAASFRTGTQPCCLKRQNRQLMLCRSAWDLCGGTLNKGGPVVSTRRPRNSLDWLGIRLDFSKLTCQPNWLRRWRVQVVCSRACR